jgi:hypothetical protein
MMDAVTEIYPRIPVCVHLDHGNEPGTCMTAIQSGFTSVMMDGSIMADGKTPGGWEYAPRHAWFIVSARGTTGSWARPCLGADRAIFLQHA